MKKEDWIRKLTSRKLWLAVAGFVSGVMMAFGRSESQAAQVGGLILQGASVLSYILAEGWRDAAEATPPEGLTVQLNKDGLE